MVTSIAFNYYAESAPDLVVLETGLGGRLDATNIVSPLITVITNISRDHTHILGSTLEKIAYEKAGIIKERIPLFTAVHDPAAERVLQKSAADKRAPLYHVVSAGDNFATTAGYHGIIEYGGRKIVPPEGQRFDCRGGLQNEYRNIFIPLRGGEYQVENAAVSIGVIESLGNEGFFCR